METKVGWLADCLPSNISVCHPSTLETRRGEAAWINNTLMASDFHYEWSKRTVVSLWPKQVRGCSKRVQRTNILPIFRWRASLIPKLHGRANEQQRAWEWLEPVEPQSGETLGVFVPKQAPGRLWEITWKSFQVLDNAAQILKTEFQYKL